MCFVKHLSTVDRSATASRRPRQVKGKRDGRDCRERDRRVRDRRKREHREQRERDVDIKTIERCRERNH